jgi:hypothetical protein
LNNDQKLDDLLGAINAAEGNAYGDGELAWERAQAIDRYYGKNIDPAEDGLCQLVSRDVFDTIEWIKPSLLKIFTGGEDVVKFEPIGPEDEAAADQETAYVNHVVTQKNSWFQTCNDWFTDALLTKNGYCMAYWDQSKSVEIEIYEGQSDEALAFLMQDGAEVIEHKSYPDEQDMPKWQDSINQLQAQMQQAMQAAQQGDPQAQEALPVMQQQLEKLQSSPPTLHDVKIRNTQESGQVKLCVLPPERCRIDITTDSFLLKDCNYFEFWEFKTISELRSMGFEVDDEITDEHGVESQEDTSRNIYNENLYRLDETDPAMRKVKTRMVWIRYDFDGDGISEMQYCIVVGDTVLFRQECSRIPVASLSPIPVPHRHIGISIADIVADIGDTKTEILRQGINNLKLSNNPRTFLSQKVNLDDALVSRAGGIVRVNGVPAQEAMVMQHPFVFPQAMQGLEYMDQIRENRSGTNRYFTGIDQNALNKTATGIKTLTNSASQRVEQIARVFSCGVENLFSIVHELISKHATKKEIVRLRGTWVQVDPTQWKKRTDFRINVGTSAGNSDIALGHLRMILEAQKEALAIGVATPENVYNALSESTKIAGFANPNKFWTDPSKAEPKPPPPSAELDKQKAELAKKDADLSKKGVDLAQKELELNKREADIHFGMKETQLKLGHEHIANKAEEMNSAYQMLHGELSRKVDEGNQNAQLGLAQSIQSMQETSAQQMQAVQMALQSLAQATQMIAQAAQAMTAPKRLVRGQDGRVIGAETVLENEE